MSTGMKIPPFIFGIGGGWQGNLRADVNLLSNPVMTTISLPMPIASKRNSRSPPHS